MNLLMVLTDSVNTSMIIAILANKSSAKNPWNNIVGIKYNKEQTLNKKLNLFLMLLIEMSAKNELSAV